MEAGKRTKGARGPPKELDFDPILEFRPPTDQERAKYQHLEVVGKIKHSIPYDKGIGYSVSHVPIYSWIKDQEFFEELDKLADHKLVKPKFKNITKAIKKIDHPLKCPDLKTNPHFQYALKMCEVMLEESLTADCGDPGEFNVTSSPGLTYKKYGIVSKKDAIESELFTQRFQKFKTPLWENCGKVEFLPMEEILDDKIRTFKVCEVDFAVRQKILFDQQNKKYLRYCQSGKRWAKYGFAKEYGGFHRLIVELERMIVKWMSDVSGWDRLLPLLRFVYYLRMKFLSNVPSWSGWVVRHTVHSLEVDENGVVFRNHAGNRSGSMDTTVDNCIAHEILMMYFLVKLYFMIHGRYPSYASLMRQKISIMGDDNLSGVTEEFCPPGLKGRELELFFEKFLFDTYAEFNLVLKPGSVLVSAQTTIDPNFEFLGCKVGYDYKYGRYIPVPRIHKVASTILYSETRLPLNIYAQRIIGLSYICYGVEIQMQWLLQIMEHLLTKQTIESHLRTEMSGIISMSKLPYFRVFGYERLSRRF